MKKEAKYRIKKLRTMRTLLEISVGFESVDVDVAFIGRARIHQVCSCGGRSHEYELQKNSRLENGTVLKHKIAKSSTWIDVQSFCRLEHAQIQLNRC